MVYSSRWILKWSSLGDSYDSHSHQLTIDWEWVGHQLHMACINVSLQYQKMAWYTNLEDHYPTCPSTLPVVLRIFISHLLALLFQDTKLPYVMELLLSVACFPLGPNLPWGTCPCKPPLRHALMAVLKVTASGRAWRSHQPSEIGFLSSFPTPTLVSIHTSQGLQEFHSIFWGYPYFYTSHL